MIEAIIRPGRRGAVVLRAPDDLGIVLFDENGLIAAYSQARPEPGGLASLAAILANGDTIIHGRIADASGQPGRLPQPQEERVAALPDSIERCRGEILRMAQSTLHLHVEPVAARFRAAPATPQGLLHAAEEVRGIRTRLISSTTMSSIAEQAERIVRAASRGN
jgi:hypothetical protein